MKKVRHPSKGEGFVSKLERHILYILYIYIQKVPGDNSKYNSKYCSNDRRQVVRQNKLLKILCYLFLFERCGLNHVLLAHTHADPG